MPVPKRKHSRARRDSRASRNMALKPTTPIACQTCQAPINSHQACRSCGYYKGVKIFSTKTDRMHKRGKNLRSKQEKAKKAGAVSEPAVTEKK